MMLYSPCRHKASYITVRSCYSDSYKRYGDRDSKAHPTPDFSVLPLGKLNGMMVEPLSVCSGKFHDDNCNLFLIALLTNDGNQKTVPHWLSRGRGNIVL